MAKVSPHVAVPERIKFVAENRLSVQLGISEELSNKLKRVQDLESQRMKKHSSLEQTLGVLVDEYLKRNDPLQKVNRKVNINAHASVLRQNPISASLYREVLKRDQAQCTFTYKTGERCEQQRWIDLHHVIPKNRGGPNSLENLKVLCSAHHRLSHLT